MNSEVCQSPVSVVDGCGRDVIATTAAMLQSFDGLRVLYDPPLQPGRSGQFQAHSNSSLAAPVRQYVKEQFPAGLFSHQHQAIESIVSGNNTVLATRTSSGKSQIYSLPALHHLCLDPDATSLFLFPQKALANDQLIKLRQMALEIPAIAARCRNKQHFVARYDGAVAAAVRPEIRQQTQILLSNPDMLHLGIMQHHEKLWARFFSNLRLIAVDECHEYRGVFGTNVALTLRRLQQICRRHGSNPKFIATSATVQDPAAHMQTLTGQPFVAIDSTADGSLQGARKMWMVRTAEHFYDGGRKLALSLAEKGLSVLVFCPSRMSAEKMMRSVPEAPHVRVYRSGLTATERESIEDGLRDRSVRVVFTTSALELGIDIGEIDVVVCVGLPHSMMSLWQRVGRAARGGREGAAIFIPAETPIDSYFAEHPEELFARTTEPLCLTLSNQRLLSQHYACAMHESGGDWPEGDSEALGAELRKIHQQRTAGDIVLDEIYRNDPHTEISLRGGGRGSYKLRLQGGIEIGEIDGWHLLRECCRNAIYRHGGKVYRVADIRNRERLVELRPERSSHETTAFIHKKIKLFAATRQADFGAIRVSVARLEVTESLANVTERDRSGAPVKSWQGNQGMEAHRVPTEGTMLLLKQDFWPNVQPLLQGSERQALESCERVLSGLFPTVVGPCDSQDFSAGVDELPTGEKALFLYDEVYDGVGLTATAFDHMAALIDKAIERVQSCECTADEGCFRCVAHRDRQCTASKSDALLVLRQIRTEMQQTAMVTECQPEVVAESAPERTCPACTTVVEKKARFCSGCGEKLAV
ncbi:DEAD/DEAH box helicase [Planctomycetia bacterium]|nr:DEAD/DEAH box helicase [Planctomycetia bacterium]